MAGVRLHPYLFFTGNCKEAMEFYKGIFGGELKIMPNEDGTVMHADLSGGLVEFMASDGTRHKPYDVSCISLSLSGTDKEALTNTFHKLAEGGKITSDLKTEVWGDTFGGLTDKYGFDWMVNISAQ